MNSRRLRTPSPAWAGIFALILPHCALSQCANGQASGFYLHFPITNRTAYSALINTVFDHSATADYGNGKDNVVVAFTGERGETAFGSSFGATINGIDLYGFRNQAGTNFLVNGNYTGGTYLYYDGHPGIDYRTTDQTSSGEIRVYASSSGVVHWSDPNNLCCNATVIDHLNGYTSHYLHLSSRIAPDGTTVNPGDPVGVSGSVGTTAPHLHFEVRYNGTAVDPYAWQGRYQDPRPTPNTNLWRPQRYASCNARWHPDGSLLLNNGTVWVVEAGKRRTIPNQAIFYAYGFDFRNAISVGEDELTAIPLGQDLASPPANYLRNSNGTIYELTDQGYKRGFPSPDVFQGQGFRWSDIQNASVGGIPDDPTFAIYQSPFRDGTILCILDTSNNGRQCVGGGTLYVISDSYRVPFATLTSFQTLGYQLQDATPVPASALNAIPQSSLVITDALVTEAGPSAPTDPDITRLANTTEPVKWFYIEGSSGRWYIISNDSSQSVLALAGADRSFSGIIEWKPVNNSNASAGYPMAGSNFSYVTVSSDGKTVTFGSASGSDPDVLALANGSWPVKWLYIDDATWYIVDGQSSVNPAVLKLQDADPTYPGLILWKPISNFPSAVSTYPAAGTHYTSVVVASNGRSVQFGAAQ
jgi:hypothetical protein